MVARKLNAHNVLGSILSGAVLLGALPALSPSSARAQVFEFSTSSSVRDSGARISERDIDALIETLHLDADQEALVRALYEGHRSAWSDASAEHRAQVTAIFEANRESNDWTSVARKTREVSKQWKATSEALEQNFLDSAKSVATDEQLQNWPRFERDRRRRTLLSTQSAIAGEGVDLVDVAESVELAPETLDQIQPVANVYGDEIDTAIADRTRAIEALEKKSTPATEGDFASIDFEAVKDLRSRLHDKRIAVRDLNERYAALFCGQLSADDAQLFMSEYKMRCFPRVYRPTAADRYIKTVRSLDTLNEEQLRALDSIEGDFTRQVGGINNQLAQVIREQDNQNKDHPMFLGGGADLLPPLPPPPARTGDQTGDQPVSVGMLFVTAGTDGGQDGPAFVGGQVIQAAPAQTAVSFPSAEPEDDSPRGKLNKSKRELVNRTIEAVAALLTPEQLALAPKPDEMQRLAPEERLGRQLQKALENAVIESTGDDGQQITITFEQAPEGSKP